MTSSCRKAVLILATALMLSGCAEENSDAISEWAVNIGGPAYTGADGTEYLAEESVSGGTVGRMEAAIGSQDEFLYLSYREGDIEIAHPIANGTYDITFHFAEPADILGGERFFDVFAEGQRAIDDLDVMVFRDGTVRSALTVTAANIVVADNELNIHFSATAMQPILSGILVRSKQRPAKDWELVWSDEFDDGDRPDPSKWNIEEWAPGVVNNEDQAYTALASNLRVAGGHLIVEAHKEDYGDAKYTSGRMLSRGKGDFLYGRFEARAKLPRGQGTWPAIWMLPSKEFTYATTCSDDKNWQGSTDCDAWPNSGEIDIMEHVGYIMGHIHGTVHNRDYYFKNKNQRKGRVLVDDVADAFHVYAMEWSAERIDIFVDDVLYYTYVNENAGWQAWPYDQPFHWIINLAIGGDWGRAGGPIDDSIFPQRLLVDYVRVYQLEK